MFEIHPILTCAVVLSTVWLGPYQVLELLETRFAYNYYVRNYKLETGMFGFVVGAVLGFCEAYAFFWAPRLVISRFKHGSK